MSVSKLGEAKRLHEMGFGIHWLRPNSKVPVKKEWTGENRDTIQTLTKEYQKGFNIGTKLGKPSAIEHDLEDGLYMKTSYLAVLDVDVKGSTKKHKATAEAWVNENFPGLLESAPITLSGRGNGSMHVWFLVDRAIDSRKLYASNEEVEVMMPSSKATQAQVEKLGQKKIAEGWRLRPAFEIDFMCAGRQVVLPPSIHPDTGKEYKWKRPIESVDDLKLMDIDELLQGMEFQKRVGAPKNRSKAEHEIVDVDEYELETRLSPSIASAIFEGSGVSDRSAMCLSIALSMVSAKFTDAEILGVLTNRDFFIGSVAFEHSQSTHRQRAARWAYDYCVHKARLEADVMHHFDSEVEVYETLSPEKAKKQQQDLVDDAKELDWRKKLDRTDNDKMKATMKNLVLIFMNDEKHGLGPDIFYRDTFANRDHYGINTPWGGVKDKALTDEDMVVMKNWFAEVWKVEPNVNLIAEACILICTKNSRHPVKEYLQSLEWDGVSRVENWLKTYLGAEAPEPYLTEVSRKFLVAAVARIYEPGKKFDYMVIFEGLQGLGKSTVGQILAGEKWFLDGIPDLHDKDAALNLQGNWIAEMGELSSLKRMDVETVKSFITRQVDKVRPPYGKRYIECHRQCVFFGTTNADAYLKDKTGNRRFWPVKVHEVDFIGLKRDRDQLWAEALNLYDMTNEDLYLKDVAKEQAEDAQATRVVEDDSDVVFGLLADWSDNLFKVRKKMIAEGKKLRKFTFRIEDLFGDFMNAEYGDSVKPPLVDFVKNPYKYQMASTALRKLNFENYKSKGRMKWRIKRHG